MTNEAEHDQELLATLREQTQVLLQEIPGPLRKVSVTAGDSAVTVEWADPDDRNPPSHGSTKPAINTAESAESAEVAITAPLVGTFYRRPEPGADPFVEEGSVVQADQTVAIVEAMKLMNPVKATQPGTVVAIHPADGEMVEFDQPLITLHPEADES